VSYQTKNIIVGAAAVYVSQDDSTDSAWQPGGTGPLGPTAPTGTANVALTEAQWTTAGFDHVGFTSEGIEVSYEPDYGEVEVDQLLDSAKLFKQAMRVSVNTTLAEATLENLMVVWGQQTDSLTGDVLNIEAGALGADPVERSIGFVGPSPRADTTNKRRERVYQVHRALQVESSAHALRRNEPTNLPASFRCFPDPARSGAEYGTVRDRSIEA
jgi:hypothetical protein